MRVLTSLSYAGFPVIRAGAGPGHGGGVYLSHIPVLLPLPGPEPELPAVCLWQKRDHKREGCTKLTPVVKLFFNPH